VNLNIREGEISADTKTKGLRADIQALRALAVLLVVVFHLWPKSLTGGFIGVDVFFVISGFLITSHIVRDSTQGAGRVIRFWARRIRRLMPASFLVICTTALAVALAVPAFFKRDWLVEVVAASAYAENWLLARKSVDYMAQGAAASPTQHFWSLSVEEQFYIVWPVMILAVTVLLRKSSEAKRSRAMLLVIALIAASSLAYSYWLTAHDSSTAYFSTPVRAWEFAAGGLLAFATTKPTRAIGRAAAIAGLALIFLSGVFFTSSLAFPGLIAMIPVAGTALVIWARSDSGLLHRVFALPPVAWLGSRSYSIYLWHWPLIILLPYLIRAELTWQTKLGVFALALLLAELTTRYVEQPFIANGRWAGVRPRKVFAGLAIVSLFVGGSSLLAIQSNIKQINQELESGNVSLDSFPDDFGYLPGCEDIAFTQSAPQVCELGNRASKVKIAAVGDSHLGAYVAALNTLGKKNDWAIDVIWKPACPYSNAQRVQNQSTVDACLAWNTNVRELLLDRHYNLVITTAKSGVTWKVAQGESGDAVASAGFAEVWSELVEAKSAVLVIRDNPRARKDLAACLAIHEPNQCALARDAALKPDAQVQAVAQLSSSLVTLLDFTETYCGEKSCQPMLDGVYVYRDNQHLTGRFVQTLLPAIESRIYESLSATSK